MSQEKSIITYFKEVVTNNYANFNGRARRREFWSFNLVAFIISTVLTGVLMAISPKLVMASYIFSFAIFIPSLAVGARRLHDVNKSGWFLLLGLIPLLGQIYILVLFFQEGHAGTNQYGANPKNPGDELSSLGME